MKIFFVDRPVKRPLCFTTRCEDCERYYDELADRVLEILSDPFGQFLCIRCDPSAVAESINLPSKNGTGR